jgi:hypothetical protein
MNDMEVERDEQIRKLAYRIWQEEGRPYGHEVQHWLKAEAMWMEEHRPKSIPKQGKPLKRTKSRRTAPVGKEL